MDGDSRHTPSNPVGYENNVSNIPCGNRGVIASATF